MSEKRKAIILGPNEGELYDVVGDRYRFLARKEGTDRSYGLIEAIVPPGGGPPPHVHSREEEGFYIIEGEVMIYVDGEMVKAGPGSFVNMPKGSTHSFRNEADIPAKMLILVAPGGLEEMFTKVGKRINDASAPFTNVDEEQIKRIAEVTPEFGIELKVKGH